MLLKSSVRSSAFSGEAASHSTPTRPTDRLRRWAFLEWPETRPWARALNMALFVLAVLWTQSSSQGFLPTVALLAILPAVPNVLRYRRWWLAAGVAAAGLLLAGPAAVPSLVLMAVLGIAFRLTPSLVFAPRLVGRAIGWSCVGLLAAVHSAAAVILPPLLLSCGWMIPPATNALASVLLLLALMKPWGVRVPVLLPAVMWADAWLIGVARETAVVRCDDVHRVIPPVQIVVPVLSTRATNGKRNACSVGFGLSAASVRPA